MHAVNRTLLWVVDLLMVTDFVSIFVQSLHLKLIEWEYVVCLGSTIRLEVQIAEDAKVILLLLYVPQITYE